MTDRPPTWPLMGPHVVLSPRVAGMIASPLVQLLRRFRAEDGGTPDSELVAFVEAAARLARAQQAAASANGMHGIPQEDDAVTLGAVDTKTAANALNITPRAVTARCVRGSLAGHKVGGSWFVWLPEEHS